MNVALREQEEKVNASILEELARRQGPCLTVVVPDYRPGTPAGSHLASARALVSQATQQAKASHIGPVAEQLVASMDKALETPELEGGGAGFALFHAPGFEETYRVHGVQGQAVLGSHFYLTPLLAAAGTPTEALVLCLSSKHLRLFERKGSKCEPIPLPAGLPDRLETPAESGHSEAKTSNRKAASPAGHGSGVHFGSTAERDSQDARLHDFFEALDRALVLQLAGRPLVVLGVKEEIAAYRRASHGRPGVWSGQAGNADHLTPHEVADQAQLAAVAAYHEAGEGALARFRELPERSRTANEILAVLTAAAEGRVHRLCIREGTPIMGPLPEAIDRAFLPAEDLVNAAAVETLRRGGEVFVLPRDRMDEAQPIAAVLRF